MTLSHDTRRALSSNGKFQRYCDDFVRRHVAQCASSFVSDLAKSEEAQAAFGLDYETLAAILEAPLSVDDYVDQWEGEAVGVPVQAQDGWQVLDSDGDLIADYESELDAWAGAYDAAGQDEPARGDILEHWLVSRDLAHWLIEENEAVALDVAGFTIWGRATSGQAISMDYVIQSIASRFLSDDDAAAMLADD